MKKTNEELEILMEKYLTEMEDLLDQYRIRQIEIFLNIIEEIYEERKSTRAKR